jgi:3-methyladenine DNA glycosylase AlkD
MSKSRPAGRKPQKTKRAATGSVGGKTKHKPGRDSGAVLASLKRLATKRTREGMARYGIPSENALGVPMAAMQRLARKLGRSHELAASLWESGSYEARTVAAFVDEPALVTPAQMDRWAADFDSWAICDTVCFHLFDRTPHAFRKVAEWARRSEEFEKRAAFALLACLALHDKSAGDESFVRCLPLVEGAATDERNFVKKGVSWALRLVGRRSVDLNAAAVTVARRLSTSSPAAARWIGKGALRELTSPAVTKSLRAREEARKSRAGA